jgi:hypothetical protein
MRAVLPFAVFVCIGCGKTNERDTPRTEAKQNPDRVSKEERSQEGDIRRLESPSKTKLSPVKHASIGEQVVFGDLLVTVLAVTVQQFQTTDYTIYKPSLIILLQVRTSNPNRLVDVPSQGKSAKVSDDVGNTYRELSLLRDTGQGIWHPQPGRTELVTQGMGRLRVDSPVTDVILFERPVEGAAELSIDLDATKYGGEGVIRLNVSRSQWEKKLERVPSEERTPPKKKPKKK